MTKEIDVHHLDKLTVKELRDIALQFPHEKAVSEMKKEELIVFIKEAMGVADETPTTVKKVKTKIALSKPEVKARIREFKLRKVEALANKNQKKARILRRRISRLKKLSRRAVGQQETP